MNPTHRTLSLCLSALLITSAACGQAKPSDADQWSKLQAIYAYEAKKPVDVKSTPVENPSMRVEHIEFTGPEGDTAKGFFSRPEGSGPFPCVLLLHGLTDSSRGKFDQEVAASFAKQGIAVFALDAPHHGQRMTNEDKSLMLKFVLDLPKAKTKGDLAAQIREVDKDNAIEKMLTETIRQGVKDYRLAIDWLSARNDIKADRIGAMGYSLGSIMSSILGAVDSRVRSVALCVGGDPTLPFLEGATEESKTRAFTVSPSLYIGHLGGRPLLMLNGKTDDVIPKSATDRLYAAAGDPKEIRWFDAGHMLPPDAVQQAVTWTVNELKGK